MISFQDIQVKFDDFVAIQNLNLDIKEGEFFTFLGPSGCGKTTTLRTLVGFITPTNGRIIVDGEDLTNTPIEKRQIGMVFQSYALFPTMTVYENIAFGLKVQNYKKEEIKKRVVEIAKVVDLKDDKLMKNVSELSGGQQQRVAIARALALAPKIIVLDEPLSNLDAKLRKQLRKELKKLQLEQGITTVYVTHDQEEALTLSDRVAVFNNGFVEQVGTPEEIYNQSKTEFVCNFIGEANSISKKLIEEISNKSGSKFDSTKKFYIRTEKIKTKVMDNDQHSVALHAKVVSKEFYGTYSHYKYDVMGSYLINIEKEDGDFHYSKGDEVTLFINPKDILQY
ncbi:ABC transporter ATP-binding protein [Metabacillus sp. Hm71]|uniref:ABC transporter ATP-binding protein n=1 Tax=Metabacillus sp. Hm71 TaxID=3450743 RepID=UPI003F43E16A